MSNQVHINPFSIQLLLNRKLWLVPLLLWAGVIGYSLLSNIYMIHDDHTDQATTSARNIFQFVELTRLWNARHRTVYVPETEKTPPNPYLEIYNRDVITKTGISLTMVNPAYMTRQLAELIKPESGIQFHITSLEPLRPENRADKWEQHALESFERGNHEIYERVTSDSSDVFRYMAPLFVKKPCLQCHIRQGYEIGEIRGGISVTLKSDQIFGHVHKLINREIIKHLSIFVISVILAWLFLEKIRLHWLEMESIKKTQDPTIRNNTDELIQLSRNDLATKLLNRKTISEILDNEFNRAAHFLRDLSIIMIKINGLNPILDQYGKATEKEVLTAVSGSIETIIRPTDWASRFSNDHFAIILPETSAKDAHKMVSNLHTAINQLEISSNTETLKVTTQIGSASFPDHSQSASSLIEHSIESMK